MNRTGIEWADRTWNPITGCSSVSEGCTNCYARRFATRLRGRCGYPSEDPFRVTFHPDRLDAPLKVKNPQRIFTCSMGDIFHPDVEPAWIDQILEVMDAAKQHTFMVLTKRPELAEKKLYEVTVERPIRELGGNDYLPNLWLGVTAENQERANERLKYLYRIPAALYFVSCEPLLGEICLRQAWEHAVMQPLPEGTTYWRNAPDWIIAGPETGPGARECRQEWVESLYLDARANNIPFFLKRGTVLGEMPREFPDVRPRKKS